MFEKLFISLLILVLSGISPFQNKANALNAQENSNTFYFSNPRKKSVSINFELINNLIVVPVVINDSDTLHFILDSGFNSIMISDLGMTETVVLNKARRVQLIGLGEGEPIQAFLSSGNDLSISGIEGKNQEIYLLTEDIFHLSSKMGRNINGILGHGFFRDFIVEINYTTKKLTFHDQERFRYRQRRLAEELPLIVKRNKSYVQTEIMQDNGSIVNALLVVDTGGSHALWLDAHTNENIKIPENNFSSLIGTGLNGALYGKIGRVPEFRIGSHTLKNVIASYPDSISIVYALGLDGRTGSLGSEILKRFNLIFDYPGGRLILRPNSSFRQAFYYNPSGIEISNPLPGYPYFIVTDVRSGSNAQKAGIKLQDELLTIQRESVKKMNLNDIVYILQGRPGRTIRLTVRREGEIIPIVFKLEEIL